MTTATLQPPPTGSAADVRPAGTLALALQEAFTVTIRLRGKREVAADAESFRAHVKHLLAAADQEARRAGYGGDHVKLAVYAYVAFLDESILNSRQPMFAGWPSQPLQEEIFGDHVAGETFYRHLEELLGAADSADVADVLEVFQLCMLLGFRGRYALGDASGLRSRIAATEQKINRIRGAPGDLAPAWDLPGDERARAPADPWLRRLVVTAAGVALLALCLFVVFRFALAGDLAAIDALTATSP